MEVTGIAGGLRQPTSTNRAVVICKNVNKHRMEEKSTIIWYRLTGGITQRDGSSHRMVGGAVRLVCLNFSAETLRSRDLGKRKLVSPPYAWAVCRN